MSQSDSNFILKTSQSILQQQADNLANVAKTIGSSIENAIKLIAQTEGRVVIMGVGKSGHIGNKIAATLASTGTSSFFVHPTEAAHGDLGMIEGKDVVILLSKSGSSDEINTLIPALKKLGSTLILLTMAKSVPYEVDCLVSMQIEREACPLDLAPTTSTTVTMAVGDAIALTLMHLRGTTPEDFARSHPAGRLGKRLLTTVADLMHPLQDVAVARVDALLLEVLPEMTAASLGMLLVLEDEQCQGVFSDGDLRRALLDYPNIADIKISDAMTREFQSINIDELATEALSKMQEHKITSLVVEKDGKCLGLVTMRNLISGDITS